MAAGRLSRRLVRLSWWGGLLGGLLWAAGCSSPPVGEQTALPLSLAPGGAPASSRYEPAEPARPSSIQQAQHAEEAPPPKPVPAALQPSPDRYPIDLATSLRLGGANNLQIALAGERVREAQAVLQGANALWLPSLNAGVGYNRHTGQIQDTRGDILEVRRSALFAGGGPNFGPAPLTGGTNGPARLFLGMPLADLLFAPLAERQLVQASRAALASTFNDTLLQVARTYLDLVLVQGQVAIADEAVKNAEELVRLVESRVKAGTAPPADGLRAEAELADRRRLRFQAEEAVRAVSAELVRLLRLDPAVTLFPLEAQPVPIHLVDVNRPLPALLAQGIASRPELAENRAVVNATLTRLRQEQWRPWLPTLQVGLSSGGFGGGKDSFFGDFSDRADFDALLVWELRNLGFGNRAFQRQRASQSLQARLTAEEVRDLVAAEITRAYYQVRYRRQQIEAARSQAQAAAEALPLNFKGIKGLVLRAIEAQQAVQALAFAQNQYLAAIIDYNRAQFELLRALGQAPDSAPCDPTP